MDFFKEMDTFEKIAAVVVGLMILSIPLYLLYSHFTDDSNTQKTNFVCPDGLIVSDSQYCFLQKPACRDYGISCEDEYGMHEISEEDVMFCSQNSLMERYFICQKNHCEQTTKELLDCTKHAPGYICDNDLCMRPK